MTKLVIGDRNKLIENYSLEKLRFINPDESINFLIDRLNMDCKTHRSKKEFYTQTS